MKAIKVNPNDFCDNAPCVITPEPACAGMTTATHITEESDYTVGMSGVEYRHEIRIDGDTPHAIDPGSSYPDGAVFTWEPGKLVITWTPTDDQADQVHEWSIDISNCDGSAGLTWETKVYTAQLPLLILTDTEAGGTELEQPININALSDAFVGIGLDTEITTLGWLDGFALTQPVIGFDYGDLSEFRVVAEINTSIDPGTYQVPIFGTLEDSATGSWYLVNFTIEFIKS